MREFTRPLVVLCLALAVAIAAPSHRASSPGPAFQAPMRFVGTMPAIEVMVNGKGPFLFGVDTGGQGKARIDSSLMEKLGLKPSGAVRAGDPSERNPQMLHEVLLQSVEVAGLRFADVKAVARNFKASPRMAEVDGILTLNLFADYRFTLDYPDKSVRISKGELPPANGTEILNYASDGGIPVMEITFGNATAKAHLDSGNVMGAFVFPASLAEKLTWATEPVTVGRARSMSGEMEIKEGRAKESVRLGGYEFAEPTITFPALSVYANVGSKILREFTLTFDQRNKRLRLVRSTAPGATP